MSIHLQEKCLKHPDSGAPMGHLYRVIPEEGLPTEYVARDQVLGLIGRQEDSGAITSAQAMELLFQARNLYGIVPPGVPAPVILADGYPPPPEENGQTAKPEEPPFRSDGSGV